VDTLTTVNAVLGGFFACAAITYAVHWWFSRHERVLLVFWVQCALYAVFCMVITSFFRARTIPEAQANLDRVITLGLIIHILLLHLYADLGGRRDRAFRAFVTGGLALIVLVNQWVPVRGTVLELRTMQLPWGGTGLLAIRTPPGALLAIQYLFVAAIQAYAFFVARAIWKRDRAGAILVAIGAAAILGGGTLGFLVDFAKVRAPYAGALPHAINVLCVAFFLSREYSARGALVAATGRQFEAAFDHSPIGKALLATDGRFLRINRAFCDILGSTAAEICARRLHDIFRDDDGGSIEAESRRLLGGEIRSYTVERRLVGRDGSPVWALLAVSVVPDDRGQPVQMFANVQDVTEVRAYRERLEELVATRTRELREAKDEAERASQAKSRFLAHISHEIRSPLHVMLLNALLLESDPSLGAKQLKRLETIDKSGKHLTTLLNNVLEMSKVEAGRAALVEAPFDIGAILDEVAQMFAAQAASNGTELRIEPSSRLPRTLLGDGGKVEQILINLVSNAAKFTRQGSICVAATWSAVAEAAALVEVVVADTGIGIAEPDLARMFQPFEQLEGGARAGGTGLGLAISLAYARLMGGDLSVESAPGSGSKFKFTFMAKLAGPERARESLAPPRPFASNGATRWKVLIVDDMDVNRDVVAEVLGNAFETRTAADGTAAISIHADWCPDVVLMDLRMPGMNGLEAISRLRAAGSRAAIGALTAGAFGNDEREALRAGADFFMRKPFDARELLDGLTRVFAAAERRSGVRQD
jgi:PAS domain S-box-containing protein